MDKIEETLADMIRRVPGATMAALLAMDGVGVQMALNDTWQEMGQEVVEVEMAALSAAVQKAAARVGAGTSPEFFLGTVRGNFVGAMLDADYFLVLGLDASADLEVAGEALAAACQMVASSDID